MVILGQEGFAWRWGDCRKYLKRGWNRKEGRGHKDFKKRRQAGSRVGALKRGEGWNLLTNYVLLFSYFFYLCLQCYISLSSCTMKIKSSLLQWFIFNFFKTAESDCKKYKASPNVKLRCRYCLFFEHVQLCYTCFLLLLQ